MKTITKLKTGRRREKRVSGFLDGSFALSLAADVVARPGPPPDVASRALTLDVADDVLAERRAKVEAAERPWQPRDRDRPVSKALRAYAALATSAHTGAVRRVP